MEHEILLQGGNVTGVVRVGKTVRRKMERWSKSVHAFLLHLEKKGFIGAPKFLGIDEKGREILTFLEGEVGNYPLPLYMWSEDALIKSAQLIKEYHEAAMSFLPLANATWQMIYPDTSKHEIICHNDLAPYNTVYTNNKPYAFIDFDCAGPGPRVWDVAYAAYCFVPLLHTGDPTLQQLYLTDPQVQGKRLQIFCDAYGISANTVLNMVKPRLESLCTFILENAAAGNLAFQKMLTEGHLRGYQNELTSYQQCYSLLAEHLSS